MADDDVQYESKDVRAIRGTEARTIAKWQKDGWELVTQSQGPLLQTKLTFRRPKPKTPWRLLAVLGGFVLLLIIFAVIMGAIQGGGSSPEPTTSPTEGAVAPSEQPSEEPTPEASVEAEEPDLAGRTEAALLAGLGVDNFTAMLEREPTMLWGYIASVESTSSGIVNIVVQVTEADTSKEEIKLTSQRVMSLLSETVTDLNWVVVQTADGRILEQTGR